MPSAAFLHWQADRFVRLNQVEAHCIDVSASIPPNAAFAEETLRGYVLHLSAHFQGFCRDLYTECSQIWIAAIPEDFRETARSQFLSQLTLDKGNPSYENIKRDFNRFAIQLDLQMAHPQGFQRVTDLGHLNDWRNKAAHQGKQPLGGGAPLSLTLPVVQGWKASCDGLADSLDDIMRNELQRILGVDPW